MPREDVATPGAVVRLLPPSLILILAVPALAASLTWLEDMPFPLSRKTMRIPKWSHGALIAVQNADSATNPLIWIAERPHWKYRAPVL